MSLRTSGSGESGLETIISYLLIAGVVVSMALEATGIVMFYRYYGHLELLPRDREMFISGRDFFSFLRGLFSPEHTVKSAVHFMTLGMAVLVLTPYVRVIASALYFAWKMDTKFVVITLFVLAVLTVSLSLH